VTNTQVASKRNQQWQLFYAQHRETPARLREQLSLCEEDQRSALHETLHALKGTVSMLRLEPLTGLVSAACTHAQTTVSSAFLVPSVERVIHELQSCLEQLSSYCQTFEASPEVQLMQLIRQHNYAALGLVRSWQIANQSQLPATGINELISCLEQFDFQAAAAYLNEYLDPQNNRTNGSMGGAL